ncbi:hypothetical protein H311_01667, partial [Anncaliia algerae PRA109]
MQLSILICFLGYKIVESSNVNTKMKNKFGSDSLVEKSKPNKKMLHSSIHSNKHEIKESKRLYVFSSNESLNDNQKKVSDTDASSGEYDKHPRTKKHEKKEINCSN